MQTFLPYSNFIETAQCLDDRRLNKQITEAIQILHANLLFTGWRNHAASRMWKGYEIQLANYALQCVVEWHARGFKSHVTSLDEIDVCLDVCRFASEVSHEMPPWMGDRAFHVSHQSNLVRKDPTHYRQYFPRVADDLPYVWPAASRQGDSSVQSTGR